MVNNYHTIEDGIVRDTLHALVDYPLEKSYLSGGLSLQLTLPKQLHRITSDVDMDAARRISYDGFKEYVHSTFEGLVQRGYLLTTEKRRQTWDARLERGEEHLVIQIPRRNENNFSFRQKIVARELEHTRTVPYSQSGFRVIAYEDLTARKLIRSTTFMRSYNLTLPKLKSLDDMKSELDELKDSFDRQRFSETPEEVAQDLARIRLYADAFDVKAMQEYFGNEFEETYLEEALGSFQDKGEKMREWISLFKKLS